MRDVVPPIIEDSCGPDGGPPHFEDHCWCNPDVVMLCPECQSDPDEREGCWRCGGEGSVDYDGRDEPKIIIHRYEDES